MNPSVENSILIIAVSVVVILFLAVLSTILLSYFTIKQIKE